MHLKLDPKPLRALSHTSLSLKHTLLPVSYDQLSPAITILTHHFRTSSGQTLTVDGGLLPA